MKEKIFLLISLISFSSVYAQNEIDALRYSQQNIFGTAKFNSMGGSFGSLGGDFTSLSYNPAGIAFYQNSELSITPNITISETTSNLNGNKFNTNKFKGNLSNLGYVASGKNQNDKWKRINMGIGWNKIANYNNKFYTERQNNQPSLAELFLEDANGVLISNLNYWGAEPAFWSDLIDLENNFIDTSTGLYAFDNGNYFLNLNPSSNKTQSSSVNSTGEMGEYVFSIGTSYEEKIYFGATIGLPSINYYENSIYSESNFSNDTNYSLNNFTYDQEFSAVGNGINLKLGTIIRVGDNTKIGGAIHTPSYISIEENYSTSITTNWNNGDRYSENSPIGYFNYQITTPWKIIASLSTVLNKKYIANIEIEQTDYSFTQFYSDNYQFIEENRTIKDLYTTTTNIRFGGEANLYPFKLRAGYALYGSPYKNNPEFEMENYSGGAGIDFGSSFVDLSYTISKNRSEYYMYSPSTEARTLINNDNHYFLVTLGFRY